MEKKRLAAKKVRIYDIVNGKYFPGEREGMKPSYVISPFGQKISRVNLVATVVDKFSSEDGNYSSITVDDGTEAIRVKAFREKISLLEGIEPGDLILVVGKIKEYNGELYINGEIVRKIKNVNFESLRKLEVLNELIEQKKVIDEIKSLQGQISEDELKDYVKNKYEMGEEALKFVVENLRISKEMDYKPKIVELIDSLDEGEGVEMGRILELSNLPENVIENAINELLASGLLFEPRPGILKRVG